jgi:hydrogenase nickel incorporation protein HypA/HybF
VHELSICDSIARAAVQNAGGRRVRSVQLRVGALRQVVPDTLIYCWSVVSRGPLLEGSVLVVDLVPAEIECGDCRARSTLSRFIMSCPGCGGRNVTVVAGEELLVMSIDVVGELEPPGAPAMADPTATVVPTRD